MNKKSKFNIGCLCLSGILAFLLAMSPVTTTPAKADCVDKLHQVFVTNIYSGGFAVSWTTDCQADGNVDWGLTTALGSTTSDPSTNTTIHYAEINGLNPGTMYYFRIRSGSLIDNNSGAFYTATTGPNLSPSVPGRLIYGYVKNSMSNPVPNAVIYLQIQNHDGSGTPDSSQWVTARTDLSGAWFYDLNSILTSDNGAYFIFSDGTDNLQIRAQGGDQGTLGVIGSPWILPIPTSYPGQIVDAIVLPPPTAITLKDFNAYNPTAPWNVYGLLFGMGLLLIYSTRNILVKRKK